MQTETKTETDTERELKHTETTDERSQQKRKRGEPKINRQQTTHPLSAIANLLIELHFQLFIIHDFTGLGTLALVIGLSGASSFAFPPAHGWLPNECRPAADAQTKTDRKRTKTHENNTYVRMGGYVLRGACV